jgi:hypothetical protein
MTTAAKPAPRKATLRAVREAVAHIDGFVLVGRPFSGLIVVDTDFLRPGCETRLAQAVEAIEAAGMTTEPAAAMSVLVLDGKRG